MTCVVHSQGMFGRTTEIKWTTNGAWETSCAHGEGLLVSISCAVSLKEVISCQKERFLWFLAKQHIHLLLLLVIFTAHFAISLSPHVLEVQWFTSDIRFLGFYLWRGLGNATIDLKSTLQCYDYVGKATASISYMSPLRLSIWTRSYFSRWDLIIPAICPRLTSGSKIHK